MREPYHQTNLFIHSLPRTPVWDRVREKYRGCVDLATLTPNPFFMIEGRWIPTVDVLADQLVLDYRYSERRLFETQLPPEVVIPEVDPSTGLPVPLPVPSPDMPPSVPHDQPESSRARAGTSGQDSEDSSDEDPLQGTEPEGDDHEDDQTVGVEVEEDVGDDDADADDEPEYQSPDDEAEEDPSEHGDSEHGDSDQEAGEAQIAPETQTAEAAASDSDDCVITHVHPPKRRRTTLSIEDL
jgi:hypothetical protein